MFLLRFSWIFSEVDFTFLTILSKQKLILKKLFFMLKKWKEKLFSPEMFYISNRSLSLTTQKLLNFISMRIDPVTLKICTALTAGLTAISLESLILYN